MGAKIFFCALMFLIISGCTSANTTTITSTYVQPTMTWTPRPSPTSTLTPTKTRRPTLTPSSSPTSPVVFFRTPQIDVSVYAGVWKRYFNDEYGFSFEYPALYDVEPYSDCGVKVEKKNIRVGFESNLSIQRTNMSLDEYIDRIVIGHTNTSRMFEPKVEKDINGVRAIELSYSIINRGIYLVTFIERNKVLFVFEYLKGPGCDIPDAGIQELDAYERMISSFQFKK